MSTPPQSPPTRRPPLRRDRQQGVIAGLAAGVANHLDVDVAIVRIVFVITAVLTNGLGVLAYLAGVLFVPAAASDELPDSPSPSASRAPRDLWFWAGVGLLVVGALWFLGGWTGMPVTVRPDVVWPLVLIAFGLALWRVGDRPTPPPAAGSDTYPVDVNPVPPSSTEEDRTMPIPAIAPAPDLTDVPGPPPRTEPMSAASWGGSDLPPPPVTDGTGGGGGHHWTPPPAPPRRRSVLARLTLGLALLVAGLVWLLGEAGVLAATGGRIVAASLLVIGIGLVVGTFFGRARSLIWLGLVLTPIVIVAEVIRPYPLGFEQLRGPIGQVEAAPETVSEITSPYRVGVGSVRLDLTNLDLDQIGTERTPTRVEVEVGVGEAVVVVPGDVSIDVTTTSGMGPVTVFDSSTGAFGTELSRVRDLDNDVWIDLDVSVGAGPIDVIIDN